MFVKYYFLLISILAFLVFGLDKWLAKKGRSRIEESILLLLTFTGGTIGSLLSMAFFKHKTSKNSFKLKIGLVIALQIVILFLLKEHLINQ